MFRKVLFVVVAVASLAVPAAHATDARVFVNQSFGINGGTFNYSFGIGVFDQNEITDTGGAQQTSMGNGYVTICNPSCVFTSFPSQVIPDDAFQADPLGNTITVNVCLVPQSGPPCKTFSLTMARPSSPIQHGEYANPWVDPAGPAAHAAGAVYLYRGQYVATGTTPGATLPDPSIYTMTNYNEYISAEVNLG